jgi:hypothetical protein
VRYVKGGEDFIPIQDLCITPDPCLWDDFLMFLPPMVSYSGLDCFHARSLLSPFSGLLHYLSALLLCLDHPHCLFQVEGHGIQEELRVPF